MIYIYSYSNGKIDNAIIINKWEKLKQKPIVENIKKIDERKSEWKIHLFESSIPNLKLLYINNNLIQIVFHC